MKCGAVARNVARLVDIPRYKPKEVIPWNLQQLGAFLDQATKDPFFSLPAISCWFWAFSSGIKIPFN